MPFTREKFLSLAPKNRAKKMADLLGAILARGGDFAGPDSGDEIDQYNRLARWAETGPELLTISDKHELLRNYIMRRREAGMGPEEAVLRIVQESAQDGMQGRDREQPAGESMPWEVLLHDLRSGHNVGSIIRTSDAMGLRRIHLTGYTPGPEVPAAAGAAMGAEQWMDIARGDLPGVVLEEAREQGLPIIALEIAPGAKPLGEFQWPARGLLMVGNEELGMESVMLDVADEVVSIPMYGRKASLNVANAFALAAWEMRRAFETAKIADAAKAARKQ